MTEPTLLERMLMILRVLASIITWVAKISYKIVRGLLPGGSSSAADAPGTSDLRAGDSGSPAD